MVPIPVEALKGSELVWMPFIESLAKKFRCPVEELTEQMYSGLVHIVLVHDGEKAHALCGIRFSQVGDRLIARLTWMTGKGRHLWFDLLDDLERYLVERYGCSEISAEARTGWMRALKGRGYRMTYVIMEKAF